MNDIVRYKDWKKIDLRVAEIKEVKDHPNAEKLYLLKVDSGEKKFNIVAGLKNNYNKDELIGKKIILFTNLEKAKLRGIESEAMLLAAVDGDNVVLLTPEKEIKVGARIE
ncbi:hypothetical protein J4414_03060 [Candidatus Woesearchaeota archaeon]|nr:hypothetical protein [Candidatus Woesearchaeota archaeon]